MKVMVTIPTYNERENISALVERILALGPNIEVVVADDDSPDGTWQVVEEIARSKPSVHLLHRKENKGRGSAGKDAFHYAVTHGADLIIEMDGDLSHDPRFIPSLIEGTKYFDVVIGSRYIKGGKDLRKSLLRKNISRISTWYSRTVLGLLVKDCNSGYRCFKRSVFEAIPPLSLASTGPSIVHELLYKASQKGFTIGEVPIEFVERDKDQSKLTFGRLLQGLFMVMKIRSGLV
jgi:dolichol-phosphate mannosyltransferase